MELNVYFVPVVNTEITSSHLNPSDIREGDDIEMECKIQVRKRNISQKA